MSNQKRRLSLSSEENNDNKQPKIDSKQHSSEIAKHYNNRQQSSIPKRTTSEIIKLRVFNNFIKSVLIKMCCTKNSSNNVLDIGCGKGGDLKKWLNADIKKYIGLDVAESSIIQARERYQKLRMPKFKAKFIAIDCFNNEITDVIGKNYIADIISLQFCIHYAFENEQMANTVFSNISQNLKKTGHVIITMPDSNEIKQLIQKRQSNKIGNKIYEIRFEKEKYKDINFRETYGEKYYFKLNDAIDDCPEFIISDDVFEKLAKINGLKIVKRKKFIDLFEEVENIEQYKQLIKTFNINYTNNNKLEIMSEEEWEICNIYDAVILMKE